jgi:phospholipid transport system transporter-binding protein
MAMEVRLSGALTTRTVALEYARKLPPGDLVIDFSSVTEADSAALALLLDWSRRARASGAQIHLRSLPPGLAALADVYGIAGLLPDAC